MKKLPKGYTEEDFVSIVEGIVNYLAPLFAFAYFDVDDIKQEGFLYALEVLPKFDPKRESKLDNFLFTHIKNRLINLRRDKLSRPNPCNKCRDCNYTDKMECEIYRLWIQRNQSKRQLVEAGDTEVETLIDPENVFRSLCIFECVKLLDQNINIRYRKDFIKLIEGCSIPTFRKNRLIEELRILMTRFYGDEENWPR